VKSRKFSQRLFLAVELPRFAREHLVQGRKLWRKQMDADFRWVPPLNLHLTLRFLGELEVAKSKALSKSLDALGQATSPFQLSLGKIYAFPSAQEAKGLSLEVEPSSELSELLKSIEGHCKRLQIPRDKKPFQSQITLARSAEPQIVAPLKAPKDLRGFMVRNFTLFEGRLAQNGPTYHALRKFDLRKALES